jgi:hypothetical protein
MIILLPRSGAKSVAPRRNITGLPMKNLSQAELAARWKMSPRTLEQWRWRGVGPRYLKIGGRVIYPEPEVEAFEADRLHQNTSGALPREA